MSKQFISEAQRMQKLAGIPISEMTLPEMARTAGTGGAYTITEKGEEIGNEDLFGKYIETTKGGVDVIVSFEKPSEEELGLDYGTLDEIMEIKEVDGIKLFFVYI